MQARDLQPGSVVILEAEEWKILPPLDLENVYLAWLIHQRRES